MNRLLALLIAIPTTVLLSKNSGVNVVAEVTFNPQVVAETFANEEHEVAENAIIMEMDAEEYAVEEFNEQIEVAVPEETVAEEMAEEIESEEEIVTEESFWEEAVMIEETVAEELAEEIESEEEIVTEESFWEETVVIEETQAQEETTVPTEEVVEESHREETVEEKYAKWHTGSLTAKKGYITDGPAGPNGNDGYETWYDLDMTRVVKIMDELMVKKGIEDGCVYDYEYWVREDGCKMYGPYIMVAGDIVNTRKRGDIIEISLGTAMVCDYCEMAVKSKDHYWIDVATDWVKTYRYRN